MSKKKKNVWHSLSELSELVYSTDTQKMKKIKNPPPEEQYIEAHFSKKGRGGKVVTVLKGFTGDMENLKQIAKRLKTQLGVGGSIKEGEIIIQGNNREKIIELLKKEGYRVKKVGG